MRKITKRSAAVIGTAAVAVAATGAAWAAWTITGTGSTSAAGATLSPITATATVVGGNLWPGQTRNATVTVTNPNEFPVKVTGASQPVVTVTGANGCNAAKADLVLGGVPAATTIAGKPSGAAAAPADAGTWVNFIKMEETAESECAGATFTVSFTVQGAIA